MSLLCLSSLSASALSNLPADILPLFPRCLRILPSSSLAASWIRASSSSSSLPLCSSLYFSSSSCSSLSLTLARARRGSLSSHYYCPILPLTSFFMPPRRSLRCHSNLRWLTTAGIKASAPKALRALFNTRCLIFHQTIPLFRRDYIILATERAFEGSFRSDVTRSRSEMFFSLRKIACLFNLSTVAFHAYANGTRA